MQLFRENVCHREMLGRMLMETCSLLSDKNFTHIICGHSAALSIQRAFELQKSGVIKCGDLISVGQQNLHSNYSLWEKSRLPALEAALDAGLSEIVDPGNHFQLFHNITALDADKPVLFWLDCSVGSQLMAAFLCHLFTANGWDMGRLHMLAYAKVAELYMGILGVLNEKELQERRPQITRMTPEKVFDYAKIWRSFAGSNLRESVSVISEKHNSEITLEALPYLLRRLPSRFNGLNEIEHDILKYAVTEAPKAISGIALAMGHDETPDMVGDLYLFARLKCFGSRELKHPLIEIDNPTGHMGECQIRILPLAHEILAGRANMIELNGLDDWFGGVHLTPDNFVWREDVAKSS